MSNVQRIDASLMPALKNAAINLQEEIPTAVRKGCSAIVEAATDIGAAKMITAAESLESAGAKLAANYVTMAANCLELVKQTEAADAAFN